MKSSSRSDFIYDNLVSDIILHVLITYRSLVGERDKAGRFRKSFYREQKARQITSVVQTDATLVSPLYTFKNVGSTNDVYSNVLPRCAPVPVPPVNELPCSKPLDLGV